ncbi:MAG TPA: hypothetical protein VJT73_20605 [Polyangiaceae bacterium]|nr:hypothetical protein [Polyangiaceae bacterium]
MRIFDACLEEVRPFLRAPLVLPEKIEQLKSRAAGLPDAVRAFYLECRLSPPTPEVDLLALAVRAPAADRSPPQPTGDPEECPPEQRFVTDWLRSSVARDCPLVWLELDDIAAGVAPPFANLHVCVDVEYCRQRRTTIDESPAAGATRRERVWGLLEEMSRAALLSAAQLALLTAQLSQLPSAARLIHVSTMTGRSPTETKVYVAIPHSALADCIGQLAGREWAERTDLLEPWADAQLGGSTLYCDFTFRTTGCHSIGLVFSKVQLRETSGDPKRKVLRERLIQEGLCTLAQDAALAAWTADPSNPMFRADASRRLERWLDLKVTMTGSRLISKAYLGFSPKKSLY